jgi:hypothetical protein
MAVSSGLCASCGPTAGHYVTIAGTCDDTANFLQQPVHLAALDVALPQLSGVVPVLRTAYDCDWSVQR